MYFCDLKNLCRTKEHAVRGNKFLQAGEIVAVNNINARQSLRSPVDPEVP